MSSVTQAQDADRSEPAEKLRSLARGFRLSFSWIPGMQQTIAGEEKTEWLNAALTDKQKQATSVTKKIYAPHKALTLLNSARTTIRDWFNSRTNPFPEKGVRIFLVKPHPDAATPGANMTMLEQYEADQVITFRRELTQQIDQVFGEAVDNLISEWPSVIEASRDMLGDKFDPEDYIAADSIKKYARCWFESVNMELSKEWNYLSEGEKAAELQLIREKYEAAVRQQEEFVVQLLVKSLEDLHSSLTGVQNKTQRTIHDSTVQKVFNAVDEFRQKTIKYGILRDTSVHDIFRGVNKLLKSGQDCEALSDSLRRHESVRNEFVNRVAAIKNDLAVLIENGQVRRKLVKQL